MRYQYRFNKKERARLAVLESILADKAITPSERLAALRAIERLESAARRRAEEREWNLPEPTEPEEPTVDDLVSALEAAQKQPFQPVENKEPEKVENAENAATAPISASDVLEVTQTVPEPTTVFCAFCSADGPWNTRYPVGQADGLLLCPTCFAKMCASGMRQASAAAKAAAETPQDWAEPFAAQRHMYSSDFEWSRAVWAEQDREALDREAQERAERDRAEAAYHAARARWIQDGGRL